MKHKRMLTVVFSLILALTLSICSVFADNFSSPELPSDEELLTLVEDSVNAYKKQSAGKAGRARLSAGHYHRRHQNAGHGRVGACAVGLRRTAADPDHSADRLCGFFLRAAGDPVRRQRLRYKNGKYE